MGPSETKQAQRRATHPIGETNIQNKEKKERMCSACARFPSARRSVSGGNKRDKRVRTAQAYTGPTTTG